MKKTILKVSPAVLLVGQLLFLGGDFKTHTAEAAASSTTTATPVMMDNLFKYGLKKDVELPVTATAGGLSYTLHKIMIFDFDSTTAKTLRKQYDYDDYDYGGIIVDPEYFIWTKITITNKSEKTVQRGVSDMIYKWRIFFKDGGEAHPALPTKMRLVPNSKEALRNFTLKPGQSLTTYQALYYKGDFKYFRISMGYQNEYIDKYVVNDPDLVE